MAAQVKRLGFPDLWNRFHISTIYVQSLPLFPEQPEDAFSMLADTEHRVRKLPKQRHSRQQMLDGIEHARKVAARYGIHPPGKHGR